MSLRPDQTPRRGGSATVAFDVNATHPTRARVNREGCAGHEAQALRRMLKARGFAVSVRVAA